MSVFLNPYRFAAAGPSTTIQYVGGMIAKNTAGADFSATLAGNLTGGLAASPANGDLVVVAVGYSAALNTSGDTIGNSDTSVVGNNSGSYSKTAGSMRWSNDTRDSEFGVFYKRMGASPDTSLTLNWFNATADAYVAAIHVWRGVDSTTPFDVVGGISEQDNTSRPNPPAITPLTAGAVILAAGCGEQAVGGSVLTPPAGMDNAVVDYAEGTSRGICTFLCSTVWSGSGSYDPAATTGGTSTSSDASGCQTLALKPA